MYIVRASSHTSLSSLNGEVKKNLDDYDTTTFFKRQGFQSILKSVIYLRKNCLIYIIISSVGTPAVFYRKYLLSPLQK